MNVKKGWLGLSGLVGLLLVLSVLLILPVLAAEEPETKLDFITLSRFYEKLINHDGSYKPTVPWLAESWGYLDKVTVLMKLRQGV